jgi:hypothetical protein
MSITLNYTECYSSSSLSLDNYEWSFMINKFIDALTLKPISKKLITRLNYFLSRGYTLTCTNKDIYSSVIFPKTRYISRYEAIIVIPSVPYFTNVETICNEKFDILKSKTNNLPDNLNVFQKLQDCCEIDHVLKSSEISGHDISTFTIQPFFIMFVHELIHIIRHFEGIRSDGDYEELATIHGIIDKSLYIAGSLITENTIRQEWGYPPRISHNSIYIYVTGVDTTYVNKDKYDKDSFLKF